MVKKEKVVQEERINVFDYVIGALSSIVFIALVSEGSTMHYGTAFAATVVGVMLACIIFLRGNI